MDGVKKEGSENSLKKKCMECVKWPNSVKTLIIIACVCVVIQQISVCTQKLFVNVPITTYTHFDFNKTIMYPSITFCREPPYKFDKMLEHGLYAHPQYTSTWINFNFSKITLDELWQEITYEPEDFFIQYGLGGSVANVKLTPYVGFQMGRCYTISSAILSSQASKSTGYSFTLRHSAEDIATSTLGLGLYPPGYHVYVHYTREPFTEVEVYNGGLVDHLYVNVGETLEVKLKVDEYVMISSDDDPCSYQANYSANLCTAQHVWDRVGELAGCSGPWMVSSLPRCNNYTSMRSLIAAYMNEHTDHDVKDCPRFCRSNLYNGYVTDRQALYNWDTADRSSIQLFSLQVQLFVYFNSMMVSVYEERYNYDWNLFLSDIGGSIGFLLGLSVISLLEVCGKLLSLCVSPNTDDKEKKMSLSAASTTNLQSTEQETGSDLKRTQPQKT